MQDRHHQPRVAPLPPVVRDRDQLGHAVHLHRSVTDQRDRRTIRVRPLRTYGIRHSRSHGGQGAGQRAPDVTVEAKVAGIPVGGAAGVGGHDGVGRQPRGKLVEDPHRVHRVGIGHRPPLDHLPPVRDLALDLFPPRPVGLAFQQRDERAQGGLGVSDQVQLVRVAHPDPLAGPVDLDRPGLVERRQELGIGEVRADGQQGVAAHHQLVGGGGAQQSDRSGHPGQLIGEHVLAQQRLCRAGTEQIGDLAYFLGTSSSALADQQRDLLAGVEDLGGLTYRGIVGLADRRRQAQAGGNLLERMLGRDVVQVEDVGGKDQAGRGMLGHRDANGPVDQIRQLLRHGAHLDVVAADVLVQAEQIDFLLVGAAHRRPLGLPHDRHHRNVVELGVVQAVEQVDRTRAAGGGADRRPRRRTSRSRPPRTRPSPRAVPARTVAGCRPCPRRPAGR